MIKDTALPGMLCDEGVDDDLTVADAELRSQVFSGSSTSIKNILHYG